MHFSIEYKDASGETKYDKIASGLAPKGEWVQLANTSYTIPAGASSIQFYFETDGDTGTTCDFLVDEVIGAPKGKEIDGPKAAALPDHPVVTQPTGDINPGDVNGDGNINAADLSLAKQVFSGKLNDSNAKRGADVDQSGTVDKTDLAYLRDYLLTKISKFPVAEKPVPQVDFNEMAQKFGSVNLAKSYKGEKEFNPLITQYFGADPGVMEYDGRVYIYMTDDHLLYDNGQVTKETYSTINCLRCISSDDLVNWTDHGLINVAGQNGIAKWAGNSWAPTACHKKIDGKEKFFLYFANNANGIGVLTSDSPTGPWSDPNGKAMIDRKTAGCTDVPWVFDPAVLVDDDGKGYLYFGGGTENK
ncbi:MAG: family 43 glycosylhydrolase, partial [Oscillospiraceae bacterium]|nr:family 43 glycosylhydrolase [Oscillospiraceae bacterium]